MTDQGRGADKVEFGRQLKMFRMRTQKKGWNKGWLGISGFHGLSQHNTVITGCKIIQFAPQILFYKRSSHVFI